MSISSLHAIHDAIHGPIDLATLGTPRFREAIIGILDTGNFRRLKRVKQLGFVSANHISAGHDRYAHSIGTMYMMRRIIGRLSEAEALNRPDCDVLGDVRASYGELFDGLNDCDAVAVLADHLMLAALVQDIGELPYNLALARLEASEDLRHTVSAYSPVDVSGLEPKTVFALAWLRRHEIERLLTGFDLDFLSTLLAGLSPRAPLGLRAVRHMLDGAVDADRLDYVHRDAFHVLGVRHEPNAVLASLLYYDQDGPVFGASGPVADFLALRATLWSTVYLSPPNRFRVTLLRAVMTELAHATNVGSPFAELAARGLDYEDFVRLDDILVEGVIEQARAAQIPVRSERAKQALAVLGDTGQRYQFHWLPEPDADVTPVEFERLPKELFVDTYYDYLRHRLYDANSIRVRIEPYRYLGEVVGLEQCSGPFNHLLADRASGLPMPGCIAVFRPTDARGVPWTALEAGLQSGSLYYHLRNEGLVDLQPFDADTRGRSGFRGPDIFISFAFEDVDAVREIARALEVRKRRYYCLEDPFAGLGATTLENSLQGVREAGAVLLVYSRSYAAKFLGGMNSGNLNAEVMEMAVRAARDDLKVIPVTLEDYDAATLGALPWRNLGYDDGALPMVGGSLQGALTSRVAHAVDEVLRLLDSQPSSDS